MYTSERVSGVARPWRILVNQEVRRYFTSEPGRRWLKAWAASRADYPGRDQVKEVAIRAALDESHNFYQSSYEVLLAKE
jgi:hypothetical protein